MSRGAGRDGAGPPFPVGRYGCWVNNTGSAVRNRTSERAPIDAKGPDRELVSLITGERTVPGIWHENYWFRRHEVVYAACATWCEGSPQRVLDAGCGEGYGTAQLTSLWPAARVLGADYDRLATAHARAVYGSRGTAYLRGALTSIPLADNAFDLVVSFQTVEHVWSPEVFARELERVCRPGGTVVLSTPNRTTFSPGLGRREKPANVFHAREYDPTELVAEMGGWAPSLTVREVLGLHHSPRLATWEESHGSIPASLHAVPAEDWPPEVAALVASVTTRDFTLRRDALEASLDLVVVLRSR